MGWIYDLLFLFFSMYTVLRSDLFHIYSFVGRWLLWRHGFGALVGTLRVGSVLSCCLYGELGLDIEVLGNEVAPPALQVVLSEKLPAHFQDVDTITFRAGVGRMWKEDIYNHIQITNGSDWLCHCGWPAGCHSHWFTVLLASLLHIRVSDHVRFFSLTFVAADIQLSADYIPFERVKYDRDFYPRDIHGYRLADYPPLRLPPGPLLHLSATF